MPDLSKVQRGPCKVLLGGSEIGHTERGVEFRIKTETQKRQDDVHGKTTAELIHLGDTCEVTLTVAEWAMSNLTFIYPPGLYGGSYLGFGRKPGYAYSSSAQQMTLHPIELDDSDASYDVILWKAVATSFDAVAFNNQGERVFRVTFTALPDDTKADGMILGKIGSAN